ncbi:MULTISPECIES: hypothetical protein [unclassified Streptosporangium]|uniref:hypothetical protein n=1 Tax=unclassified Streptosporangium TaxID=2632669 RepID=UPI002E284E3E|nr:MULTISPECIES: hypothetical protein [unclassified Streptosporangium]
MTNEQDSEALWAAGIPPDLSAHIDAIAADPARRNVALALGETDPAVLDDILADLREREGLSDTAIAGLPPNVLDILDDRYHWLDDT